MANSKKVLIEVQVKTSQASSKLNQIGTATEKAGQKATKSSSAFSGLGASMLSIAKGFIIVRSFQLLGEVLAKTIKISAEFELAMAKIKAVTQGTSSDIDRLSDSARELALGTTYTATQVAELQLVYSKFGFSVKEIEAVQAATLDLATATGEDLAKSADVVAATLRGFSLSVEETERVVDVMGMAFSSSALNLENYKQAMKTLAPIAASANIDLETTTAMLGVLADRGLRGTVAATGLKNVFMAMSDPTSALAQHLGYAVQNSEAAMMAFRDLGEEGINLAVAQGLITKRSAAAFLALSKSASGIEFLKYRLDAATGSINEMADTIEDTTTGAFKIMESEWEELMITMGDNANDFVRETISEFTALLKLLNGDFRGAWETFFQFDLVVKNKTKSSIEAAQKLTNELTKEAKERLANQDKVFAIEKKKAKANNEDLQALEISQAKRRSKLINELYKNSIEAQKPLQQKISAEIQENQLKMDKVFQSAFLDAREDFNNRQILLEKEKLGTISSMEAKELEALNESFNIKKLEIERLKRLRDEDAESFGNLQEQKLLRLQGETQALHKANKSYHEYLKLNNSLYNIQANTADRLKEVQIKLLSQSQTILELNKANNAEILKANAEMDEEAKKARDKELAAKIRIKHNEAEMFKGSNEEKLKILLEAYEYELELTMKMTKFIEAGEFQKLAIISDVQKKIFEAKQMYADKEPNDLNKELKLRNKIRITEAKANEDKLQAYKDEERALRDYRKDVEDNFKFSEDATEEEIMLKNLLLAQIDLMISKNSQATTQFLKGKSEEMKSLKEIIPQVQTYGTMLANALNIKGTGKESNAQNDGEFIFADLATAEAEIRIVGDAFGELLNLMGTYHDEKLKLTESRNQEAFKLLEDSQSREADLFDKRQANELARFQGTEEQKLAFQKQKELEKEEFLKKQDEKKEKLRKKQLQEENKIAQEAFKINKANALATIAINTAIAIAKTPAEGLIVAAPVLAALVAASGAAQMAAVASQRFQPKTFQDGGMIYGDRHSQGGVPFSVGGSLGFEAEGGEYIFSRKTVDRIGKTNLDAMNFGGGIPAVFADGGAIGRASIERSVASQGLMAETIAESIAASVVSIPVINTATDTTDLARKVQNAANMAKF